MSARWIGLVAILVFAVGCDGRGKGAAPKVPAAPEGARVAKIVVLEQGECCECTQARQEATWENLQAALQGLEKRPVVDVIHFDAEPDVAQPYQDMKPVMVSPVLYFLDGDGALVGALEGELSREAITALLREPGA
ncbi:MAG: hypothetical protein ABIK09_19750 [Pseudomonadota bacterium]